MELSTSLYLWSSCSHGRPHHHCTHRARLYTTQVTRLRPWITVPTATSSGPALRHGAQDGGHHGRRWLPQVHRETPQFEDLRLLEDQFCSILSSSFFCSEDNFVLNLYWVYELVEAWWNVCEHTSFSPLTKSSKHTPFDKLDISCFFVKLGIKLYSHNY